MRTTRVYVAGSSLELDRAERAMNAVRERAGLELAVDWVAQIKDVGSSQAAGLPRGKRRDIARNAVKQVACSDVLWLLEPVLQTQGAWVELGAAAVCMIKIVSSYVPLEGFPDVEHKPPLFAELAHGRHRTDDAAFAAICELARVSLG